MKGQTVCSIPLFQVGGVNDSKRLFTEESAEDAMDEDEPQDNFDTVLSKSPRALKRIYSDLNALVHY